MNQNLHKPQGRGHLVPTDQPGFQGKQHNDEASTYTNPLRVFACGVFADFFRVSNRAPTNNYPITEITEIASITVQISRPEMKTLKL